MGKEQRPSLDRVRKEILKSVLMKERGRGGEAYIHTWGSAMARPLALLSFVHVYLPTVCLLMPGS